MDNVYENALIFAAEAHKGAVRKGTATPYITHPIEASLIVGKVLATEHNNLTRDDLEVMAAAVLHDVIEDTDYTSDDIRKRFGDNIAKLVASESENKREGLPAGETWHIRKQETIELLKSADYNSKLIAFGDKLSNMRSMSQDYRTIGDSMWLKFNNHNKADHEWYYRTLGDIFKIFNFSPLYREYTKLCDEVFG